MISHCEKSIKRYEDKYEKLRAKYENKTAEEVLSMLIDDNRENNA